MLVPANVWTVVKARDGNAVLIRPTGSDSVVPIFVEPTVAQSIVVGLGDVHVTRPLTHDLFLAVLHRLDVHVNRIEITAINDNIFYGRLVLIQDEHEELIADARPSDCIALAVRVKCPIFIDEDVVNRVGMPVSSVSGVDDGQRSGQPGEAAGEQDDSLLAQLHRALDEAVQDEDYEEAAKLRDRINEMEND
jgi:bifunctional DNase/RNase